MKVLVDMNLSPRWTHFLNEAGIKAEHWSTIGPGNAPDTEIMTFARTNHFVVLTHDLDFSAILAATHGEKPSVVQIRAENVAPETIGLTVTQALIQMEEDLAAGALITIDPNRTRLRLLPLNRKPDMD